MRNGTWAKRRSDNSLRNLRPAGKTSNPAFCCLTAGTMHWHGTIFSEHIVSIAIISAIGLIGYFKGLDLLEKLEDVGLWVTLLIVGALLVGFNAFDLKAAAEGIQWPSTPSKSWWEIITIVGGTLIVVQGFETSRYLAAEYDQETRIKSCRLSQVVSAVVYLIFVARRLH